MMKLWGGHYYSLLTAQARHSEREDSAQAGSGYGHAHPQDTTNIDYGGSGSMLVMFDVPANLHRSCELTAEICFVCFLIRWRPRSDDDDSGNFLCADSVPRQNAM